MQLDSINIDTNKYTLVAVEYKQNAYLVPLYSILWLLLCYNIVISKIIWLTYYILLSVLYKISLPAFIFLVALNISTLSNNNNNITLF